MQVRFIDFFLRLNRFLCRAKHIDQTQGASLSVETYRTEKGERTGWWWLRSPGFSQVLAARVLSAGSLGSYYVNSGIGCVRPAFWINLE